MASLPVMVMLAALSGSGEKVLLQFTADWCGSCRTMQPVVDQLVAQGYPIRQVNIDQEKGKGLAEQFGVYSVPCFVFLVDGREVDRITGATTIARLNVMLQKADAQIGTAQTGAIKPAVSNALPGLTARAVPSGSTDDASFRSLEKMKANGPVNTFVRNIRRSTHENENILKASVRLKVDDTEGHSYGSGTIIDTHDEEALVLTCGHLFRDSNGTARIMVDLFLEDQVQAVSGQLIRYDLEKDLALIVIRPGVRITPVPVAMSDRGLGLGETVFSVGCDHGGRPARNQTRITGINLMEGPPNLQVAGKPVDGRSGGGLFTADGVLVGVCKAAFVDENKGLYAAAGSVHAELDEAGLSFVYNDGGDLPKTDPLESPTAPFPLDRKGATTLAVDNFKDAEIICIVRSNSDPTARSQVIVLDQPPPELVEQLAKAMQQQRPQPAKILDAAGRGATTLNEASDRRPVRIGNEPVLRGQSPGR